MSNETLHDLEAFHAALGRTSKLVLFKHSPICPISDRAHREWQAFRRQHPDVPTLFVDVISDRFVARGLGRACGVPHQSPQAILFRDGAPVWDASHDAITTESLAEAWAGH
ncbi:MAG: bacillithiol system redox-active protein YtxJ [Planctomycetota bacterium]|jgi:bacillithiol system protein YtxJ